MSRWSLAACMLAGLVAGGCGNDQTPTSASAPPTFDQFARLFTGTLEPRGTQYYSFTLPQASGVFVTLASVTAVGERAAEATPLGIGLGVPRGTECVLSTQTVASPGLAAQLREFTPQGVRCVAVYDPAVLPASKAFAVRIGYFR